MSFFGQPVDRREIAYGSLALSTLEMLREAVAKRESEGETRAEIARRIGIDRSQLSRTLNGRVKNITLRTVSDILFAAGHTINEIGAEPWERLSQNWSRDGQSENIEIVNLKPKNDVINIGFVGHDGKLLRNYSKSTATSLVESVENSGVRRNQEMAL